MIASFGSKALKRFWTKGEAGGLKPEWLKRCRLVLTLLDAAANPQELDAPGLGFHPLTGKMAGRYSIFISRNWRITFGWDGKNVMDGDLEDYHGS